MNATLDTALNAALPEYRGRDALYCLMAWVAEDMDHDANTLCPVLDVRLNKGYVVRAYITGADCLFRRSLQVGDQRRFYGFIIESKAPTGQYYAVIRGTDGTIEWIEDAEYIKVPHPRVGHVESGFWGIYETLRCIPVVDGVPAQGEFPLIPYIRNLVGTTVTREHCAAPSVTTIGHSLGAALATYLGVDVAEALKDQGVANSVYAYASPHPGDRDFCEYLMETCPTFRGWKYELDLVPKVPFLLGYQHPSGTLTISPFNANARIRVAVTCNHHALCYVAMLDKSILTLPNVMESAQQYLSCIVGEAVAKPASRLDALCDQVQKSDLELQDSIARDKLRRLQVSELVRDKQSETLVRLGPGLLKSHLRALGASLKKLVLRRGS